ncbi:MAG: tRNA (adenosine(37)-N6)-threonylcarbamoyltransferase complex transferase subunit TsaD [Candidatus Daviesbacteria bacterium]|nr:tRNA (adenosine(37)-N6)-threonylcarbamoyltransferase complex transferase subunit TsaD [Candidatus Daviesbacteria bacterium]
MIILGIETSCDETSAAVLKKEGKTISILSNIIASSASLQAKYGGIIPEQAAREQLKSILPVITEALEQAKIKPENLDAIAVTYGPGLIGSLLVGTETAKVLSLIWNKPLIGVNHLLGHFYANWIANDLSLPAPAKQSNQETNPTQIASSLSAPRNDVPSFPCIGLLVSGGHTDLVLFQAHGKYEYLGGTRDDAAGECFDKSARLLGLPYPGGPEISKLALTGDVSKIKLPSPLINSKDFDFSFSGLKTAVANMIKEHPEANKNDLSASIEEAIINVLVEKTVRAAKTYGIDQIIIAGGVAANKKLTETLRKKAEVIARAIIFTPPPILCTDNGAMIAAAAFFLPADATHQALQAGQPETINPDNLQANPNLSLVI